MAMHENWSALNSARLWISSQVPGAEITYHKLSPGTGGSLIAVRSTRFRMLFGVKAVITQIDRAGNCTMRSRIFLYQFSNN